MEVLSLLTHDPNKCFRLREDVSNYRVFLLLKNSRNYLTFVLWDTRYDNVILIFRQICHHYHSSSSFEAETRCEVTVTLTFDL